MSVRFSHTHDYLCDYAFDTALKRNMGIGLHPRCDTAVRDTTQNAFMG